jgi:riboflavin synthase
MFTGIIQETGKVQSIKAYGKSIELGIRMRLSGRGLRRGDSVAVNGCCLTAVKITRSNDGWVVKFDLLKETWNLTNLRFAKAGSLINLERPLAATGRLDGHFVTGHIDGTGEIIHLQRMGSDHVLDIKAPGQIMRYIVQKGSIAVDGISLTVAGVQSRAFRVWIIPHTWEITALRERRTGDAVNLETDLLGKYVRKFISSASKS